MTALTIGRVAREAGVNLQTVRYYQRRGLIQVPPKPLGGYRVYEAEVVDRLRFVKRAQHLGFTLNEIRELLDLGNGQCGHVEKLALAKRDRIERQIHVLKSMQKILDRYLEECGNNRDPKQCSMIEAIATGACCDMKA